MLAYGEDKAIHDASEAGANGYIAVWVVRVLLERGYAVRGTVRTEEKGKHLKETFKSYGDKFEVVVVEDNIKVTICAISLLIRL